MGISDYHFVTHWKIKGPIQKVYTILSDGAQYARWWQPSYVCSEAMKDGKIKSIVRAKLPYTLAFTTELVSENPPHDFLVKASEELVGTGHWKLKQVGEETHIEFYWDVVATKALVRSLSLFLKPIFKWNHTWVMKNGEKRLQQEVNRQL